MASLRTSHFSPEVWSQVLSYLQEDTYHLHTCCLVSRTWYALAMPLLWHSPQFTSQMDFASFEKAMDSNPLLSTLVSKFDLTDYRAETIAKNFHLVRRLSSLRSLHLPLVLGRSSVALECLDHMTYLEEMPDLSVELSTQGLTQLVSILNSSKHLRQIGLTFKSGNGPLDVTILSSILTLPNIDSLCVAFGAEFDISLLEQLLSKFPKLARFEVNSKYTPRYVVRILAEHCHEITSLSLGTFSGLGDEFLDDLCRDLELNYASQLREFTMSFYNDWPIYSERFTRNLFKSFYNLETLRLSGIRLNNSIVRSLAESLSPKLKALELTCISYRDLFADEVWDSLFAKIGSQLKSLILTRAFLPPNIGQSIAGHCPALERLSLGYTNIKDDSLIWVVQGCGHQLRQLDISDTDITKDGLRSVFNHCSKLQDLAFAKLSNGPEFQEDFEDFLSKHGHQLQRLDLSFLTTRDDTLISVSKYAKNLRELIFTDQAGVSDRAVSGAMRSCRKLKRLSVTRYSRTAHSISQDMLDEIDQHYVHVDLSHRDSKRS